MKKIIIAGGRNYSDYDNVELVMDKLLVNSDSNVIVYSGRCNIGVHTFTTDDGIEVFGADGCGERYAKERGYSVSPHPADWKQYGKRASYLRNKEMAVDATHLIAFWDGKSKGTKMMIDLAKENNLIVRIININ